MKYTTTFIDWRGTALVPMQSALNGSSLSTVQSAYGYGLLQNLLTAGALYDANGDDSPYNVGTFSVGTCQPYMDAATPLFLEQDRICRYIYAQYASTVTLAQAQGYSLYLGLTSLPPGIEQPVVLVFTWLFANIAWDVVRNRTISAAQIAVQNGNTSILAELNATNTASTPYFTAPVNPGVNNENLSLYCTDLVNASVTACTTWLGTLAYT